MAPLRNRRNEKGSSLAESMVALGLVVMGLLGIVVLYTRSLSLNRDVANRTIAAGLAAEGIEVVKNLIDTNIAEHGSAWWTGFLEDGQFEVDYLTTLEGCYQSSCLPVWMNTPLSYRSADASYVSAANGGNATAFNRRVSISLSTTKVRVNSVVNWNERGTTRTLEVEDHFFNWRP